VNSDEAVVAVIDALQALDIPYILVGSLASNLYGIPRSTQDADFSVQIAPGDVHAILARLGPQFRLDPQVSFETVTGTMRYVVSVAGIPYRIEFFCMNDDPFARERFARRQRSPFFGRRAFVPTPEDVVVMKLRWALSLNRPKDAEDARGVIAVQGERLDWDYVRRWCDHHGTRQLLEKVRASTPPPRGSD
jgi:hypothetical protein